MNLSMDSLLDIAVILVLIAALWQFNAPRGAKRGNLTAALALACALLLVLARNQIFSPGIVVAAAVAGAAVGYGIALRVDMIQIPAMVAFQHGAGGVAAFLVSYVELVRGAGRMALLNEASGIVGLIIGAATFSGSMIASGKLANKIRQTPQVLPGHGWMLLSVAAACLVLGLFSMSAVASAALRHDLIVLVVLSVLLGVLFSLRIGGADMPVLISFLNATAGLAAAFCGVVIENRLLIACGATVAASGSILTHVMCKAMNRSVLQVFLLSAVKSAPGVSPGKRKEGLPETSPVPPAPGPPPREEDSLERAIAAAKKAQTVIVIPGYGMAMARAQFEVVNFVKKLLAMGKEVKYAIHPVAGRMPGHMNVLLAEADVDYAMLYELEDVNPEFAQTDVVLVVGACDVVNPAAIQVEGTPISGMPILLAHHAKSVVVCNLDERPGYSGVQNPLYRKENTILLWGDAKKTIGQLTAQLA